MRTLLKRAVVPGCGQGGTRSEQRSLRVPGGHNRVRAAPTLAKRSVSAVYFPTLFSREMGVSMKSALGKSMVEHSCMTLSSLAPDAFGV